MNAIVKKSLKTKQKFSFGYTERQYNVDHENWS